MTKKDKIFMHRLLETVVELVKPTATDDTALIEELRQQLGHTEVRGHSGAWITPSRNYLEKLIIAARFMVFAEHAKRNLFEYWRIVATEVGLPEDAITLPSFQKVKWRVQPEVEKRMRDMNLI